MEHNNNIVQQLHDINSTQQDNRSQSAQNNVKINGNEGNVTNHAISADQLEAQMMNQANNAQTFNRPQHMQQQYQPPPGMPRGPPFPPHLMQQQGYPNVIPRPPPGVQWQQRGPPQYQQPHPIPQMPPRPMVHDPIPKPGVFSMSDRDYNTKGYRQLRIGNSERMTGRELANLVRMQLTAVQSGNTYSDDYYFLKYSEEKRRQLANQNSLTAHLNAVTGANMKNTDRPAALLKEMTQLHKLGSTALGVGVQLGQRMPMPNVNDGWMDRSFVRETKRDQATRDWEQENKVLGHTTKSNLKRPRELITLIKPNSEDLTPKVEGDEQESSLFSGIGWSLRSSIEEAADAVLEIEDMHRLLKAKIATLPPAGANIAETEEILRTRERVQTLRSKQKTLCNRLGVLMGFSDIDVDDSAKEIKVESNLQQLLNIIWLPKGRRVVCRVVSCLLPAHHTALMESFCQLLVYFVCTSADGNPSEDPIVKEKQILDDLCTNAFGRELASLDLIQLCNCLGVLLNSQTPESLRAVIATPGGANIVRELMMRGQFLVEQTPMDKEKEEEHATYATEWSTLFAKFIEMAEEGISAKE